MPEKTNTLQAKVELAQRAGYNAEQIRNSLLSRGIDSSVIAQVLPKPLGTTYVDNLKGAVLGGGQGMIQGATDAADALGDVSANQMPQRADKALESEIGKGYKVAMGGIDTGLAGIGTLFSPVSAAIGTLAERASDNPEVQRFAMNIGPHLDKIKGTLDALEQQHPELVKNIDRVMQVLTLGEGAPKAGEAIKSVTGDAIDAVKNSLPDGPDGGGSSGGSIGGTMMKPVNGAINLGKAVGDVTDTLYSNAKRNVRNFQADAKETAATKASLKSRGPNALGVFQETGTPEFVNVVDKTKSLEDLRAKSKMLDTTAERISGAASDKLPRHVIADDYITPRTDALRTRLEELGKIIGGAKSDASVRETTDVVNHMISEAKKQGVIVRPVDANEALQGIVEGKEGTGHFTFEKAPGVSGIDTARISAIKNMFEGFSPDEKGGYTNTVSQLAQTRKNLSDLTKRNDSAKEVVSPGGPVDSTRRAIAQKISPEYHQATKDYSDIARVLEQLDPDLKVKLSEDEVKNIRGIKFADLSRRLLSNNAAQAKSIFKSLEELHTKEMGRQGKEIPKQDLQDLVDFAGSLEEGFGITPRNSFFGQISGGVQNGLSAPSTQGVLNTVSRIMTKPIKNNAEALRSMQAYIKEAIEKKEAEKQ